MIREKFISLLVAFLAAVVPRLRSFLAVVACGLIVTGVALWSIPAALIVAGLLLLTDRLTD